MIRKSVLLLIALPLIISSCNGPSGKTSTISLDDIAAQLQLLDENILKLQEQNPVSIVEHKKINHDKIQ